MHDDTPFRAHAYLREILETCGESCRGHDLTTEEDDVRVRLTDLFYQPIEERLNRTHVSDRGAAIQGDARGRQAGQTEDHGAVNSVVSWMHHDHAVTMF